MIGRFFLLALAASASGFKVAAPKPADKALKLRGGSGLAGVSVGTINLVNALYYGGYGVGLAIDHDKFFGPDAIVSYTRKDVGESAIGKFFSRFTGVMFLAVSSGYLFEADSATLAKQFGLGSLGFVPLLFKNSQDDENYKTKMWKLQHLIHIPLTIFTFLKAFKKD